MELKKLYQDEVKVSRVQSRYPFFWVKYTVENKHELCTV